MRSTTWIYVNEYKPRLVYHGGRSAGTRVVSLELNAFEGGLDDTAKATLIAGITKLVRKYAGIRKADLVPVYVVFRDLPPSHFGVFGQTVTLDELRNPPADAPPV